MHEFFGAAAVLDAAQAAQQEAADHVLGAMAPREIDLTEPTAAARS
jgi:hypothetical protein